jgi:ribosomal protein S18 acetylase RimI-like enzyme
VSPARPDGRIRRARPDDIPRLVEIRAAVRENRLGNPAWVTLDDYTWFIANPGIWVWDDTGILKGLAAGDPRDGSIWALFVDPRFERQGIGRALFAAACASLRDAGHRVATLSTEPGTRAERFYRAAGWTVVGRSPKGELVLRSAL